MYRSIKFLVFSFVLFLTNPVSAQFEVDLSNHTAEEESSTTLIDKELNELQSEIDHATEIYLASVNATSLEDLSYLQTKELMAIVNDLKFQNPLIIEAMNSYQSNQSRTSSTDFGKILVTGDSQTSIFKHGHAGIHAKEDNSTIEAKNPEEGIVFLENRIQEYWARRNASMLGVVGATESQYDAAYQYASDKVDTGYDLMPGTPEMYCSELVYYAWQSAGISLYTHTVGFIMPSAIYNSAKTYPVEVWGSGY